MYVFDSSSFIVLGHYFPDGFPTFWKQFDSYAAKGKIVSVREVFKELDNLIAQPHLLEWIRNNKSIFHIPSAEETEFVAEIFKVSHFQYLITEKQRLKGSPVADPMVIASAKINSYCVVTEEKAKANAAKIPNVCSHFGIDYTNLNGFMKKEGWEF